MNTITTIFVAALFGCAFASPIAQQEESRTLLTGTNGMYLGLNTTTLTIGLVLIAAVVVGVILLQGSGLLEGVTQQKRYDQYYPNEHHQHHHHTKRSLDGKFTPISHMINLYQQINRRSISHFISDGFVYKSHNCMLYMVYNIKKSISSHKAKLRSKKKFAHFKQINIMNKIFSDEISPD